MNKKALAVLSAAIFLTAFAIAQAQESSDEVKDPWNPPMTAPTSEETAPAKPAEVVKPTGYPVAEIDRPLSLPRMMLEPRLKTIIDFCTQKGCDNFFSLQPGASMGLFDSFEAGLDLPIALSPDVGAGMNIYGQYEFSRMAENKLFLAGRARMVIPFSKNYITFWPNTVFNLLLDAPLKYKFGESLAIVGGGGMGFSVGRDPAPSAFLFYAEGGALFQATEQMAMGIRLGLYGFIADDASSQVPLMLDFQYTLMGDLDLWATFGFSDLSEGADWLQLMIGAGYRFAL